MKRLAGLWLLAPLAALATGCAAAPDESTAAGDEAMIVAGGASIPAEVAALRAIFAGGRARQEAVAGGLPLQMVEQYVAKHYADEPELVAAFTYASGATSLEEDTRRAGTLRTNAAFAAVLRQVKESGADQLDAAAIAGEQARARAALLAIVHLGGTFGYDGWQQNGCAAPTPYLLVLDPKDETVYGIDLLPCEE